MNQSPILSGKEYLSLPRNPDTFLISPLLPSGGSMMVYGDPKIGKSYAALQLVLAMQKGGDWLGFSVPHPVRPVYIQLDTPRSLWAKRLVDLTDSGVEGIDDLLLADRETLDTWPFDILNPAHASKLRSALALLTPDVVVIDTLREAHNSDENDSTMMKVVLSSLIAVVQPAALMLIHHAKKPSPDVNPDLINDMRGGYIAGAMDAIIRFSKKGVHFVGRSIEQGSISIERMDNGFWAEDDRAFQQLLQAVISNSSYPTLAQQAEALGMLANRPTEACRAAIRRVIEQAR